MDTVLDTTSAPSGARPGAESAPRTRPRGAGRAAPPGPVPPPPAPASAPAQVPAAAPPDMGAGGEGAPAPTPHSTMISEPPELEVHETASALGLRFRAVAKCGGRRDERGRLWASAEKIGAACGLTPETVLRADSRRRGNRGWLPRGAAWIAVVTALRQGVVGRVAGTPQEVVVKVKRGARFEPGDELVASKSPFGWWEQAR